MIRIDEPSLLKIDSLNSDSLRAQAVGATALIVVSGAGLVTFALPFIVSGLGVEASTGASRTIDASLLLAVIVTGTLVVTVGELARGPRPGSLSRSIALLATLVAIDATLRLAPSFYGASPIFGLIILVGCVFGARFGFVMGALTLFLSAAITAGVGPWLPFQMLCAGWVGLASGWLPRGKSERVELTTLVVYGLGVGFAFGALMNLYSWPFAAPAASADVGLYWSPTLSLAESLQRYAKFYVTTSLLHDATRAAATAAVLLVVARPVLRLLRRFQARALWTTTVQH